MNGYNFTGRVRNVLAFAREESTRRNHEYVGTEHLLLGLIREGEGVAAAVFANLHVDLDAVTALIEKTVTPGKSNRSEGDLPYTTRSKKVLELAMSEARELNHSYVGTEHLLLGLLREETGIAAQVLTHSGLRADAARVEVKRLLAEEGASDGKSFSKEVVPLWPADLDALVAAPTYHRLLLENEAVRVLDTEIPPGETTPLHTHRWPAAHYVLSWSDFVRRDRAGTVLLDTRQTDLSRNVPQVLWGAALPAHTLENVGNAPLHIISVEIKNGSRAATI